MTEEVIHSHARESASNRKYKDNIMSCGRRKEITCVIIGGIWGKMESQCHC